MQRQQPKIAIIGAGKMGEAIISGLLKSGKYTAKDIEAHEIIEARRKYIAEKYGVECPIEAKLAVNFADIVIIAVKPGDVAKALQEISPALTSRKIVVSIAAGVKLEFIRKHLPSDVAAIRVMPNIACEVNEAMITISPSENTKPEQLKTVMDTLGLLGKVMRLDEKYVDVATGLVGSGPAYIYLIIDALADAGVRLGLPKDVAITLAAQTTLGAAKMVVETGEHPAKLKDMVVTPAGTTIEGLLELERGKVRAVLISAVTKAAERAKALQPA